MVEDWLRDQNECAKCGRPREVCSDPQTVFYPQRTICYADMERQAVQWRWDQLHGDKSQRQFHDGTGHDPGATKANWSATRSAAFPYSADDGVTFWVATEDLTPDDNFLDGGDQPSPSVVSP